MLPSMPPSYPYTDAHLPVIHNTLQSTQILAQLIAKGKNIGLDLSGAEAANNQHISVLQGIKKQFFPNHQ